MSARLNNTEVQTSSKAMHIRPLSSRRWRFSMRRERSLDESLDEIDRWSERLVEEIEGLTPDETVAYFRKSKALLEQRTGRKLKIPTRRAPHPESVPSNRAHANDPSRQVKALSTRSSTAAEKTLAEALDEIDSWSDKVVRRI